MKAISLVIVFILLFTGCNLTKEKDESLVTAIESDVNTDKTVKYEEGIIRPDDRLWERYSYFSKTHGEWYPFIDEIDLVPDKETAISLAELLFETIKKEMNLTNYELKKVFLDTEDKIWLITYYEYHSQQTDYIIGNVCIAIQMSDAKILAIWIE